LAAKVKAGTVGQAHVEDDEMGIMLSRALDAFDAGSCPCDGIALPLQPVEETASDGGVVFDQQEARRLIHRTG
jgi:hypothetical protein